MAAPPLNLNEFHRNTLRSGFKYIDKLLSEGLASIGVSSDDGAVFSPVVPDATLVQRKVAADQAVRLRRAMRAALEACGIAITPPNVSAVWTLRTHLNFIEVALEEFDPKHLRGYGPIDNETAAGFAAALAQIRTVLTELNTYLGAGLGGDLTGRLARLDQTKDEVRLLRELERIITAHGLVEFRQPLAALLERLERNWWTVAFVGRVSCGKSSLLNFLLGTDVLPSGVTPVTAVPVRIVGGSEPVATISFASGKPERIPAAQLDEYASEEYNPGNARHVSDIVLELPSPRLAADVCFVDTPGLGSLATDGAAQTLAFLPRCDVGVVMIDAAATPTEEDIAVARSLCEGGAEVLVVVSKADLLVPADREKMRDYIARQFATSLGRNLPVVLVSVAAGHTTLAEAWWNDVLAPRQTRHRELAASTLRRKIGALREAVVARLSRQVGGRAGRTVAPDARAQLGVGRAAIENGRRKAYEIPFNFVPPANVVLDAAAAALVVQEQQPDLRSAFARELAQFAAHVAEQFDSLINETRKVAEQTLTAASARETTIPADLLKPASRPLFDPSSVVSAGDFPDGWKRWPTATARRASLRRSMRAKYTAALDEALRNYCRTLVGWTTRYLDDLDAQFNAQAGLIEAAEVPADSGNPAAPEPQLIHDFEILRDWDALPAA